MNGFSPEQIAFAVNHPEQMIGNFPSGVLNNLNSVVYNIYPLLDRIGLSITHAWAGMILLEIALFAAAAFYTVRSLVPAVNNQLASIVAITFIASSFLMPDMANLHFPFYGWVYGFAHTCFLVTVAASIGGRFIVAAIAVVLCFMIHPIIGLFTAIFAFTVVVAQYFGGERLPLQRLAVSTILTVAGCGAWTFWIMDRSTLTAGVLDDATFIALNRAQNFHWFPSYLGYYWEQSSRQLLPLLSTLALTAWAYERAQPMVPARVARQLAFGVLALMALCCIGLIVAEFVPWPPLIKLALHRADRNALIAGGLLALPALYRDLREGDPVERALAVVLLAVPFIGPFGLEPLPVGLRVGYAGIKAWRRGKVSAGLRLALMLLALIVILLAIYSAAGLTTAPWSRQTVGIWLLLVLAAAIARWLEIKWEKSFFANLVLVAVAIAALNTSQKQQVFRNDSVRLEAHAALDAQLWIRNNTPPGSLLMVDPSLSYFGRDKSQRPSFGTPREWLLISILYDTRKDLLDEGLRRYRALGLADPDYIYDPANRRMAPMLSRIYDDASRRYYAMNAAELDRLTQAYHIRYFIYRTATLKADPPLPVVYRNKYFLVAAAN